MEPLSNPLTTDMAQIFPDREAATNNRRSSTTTAILEMAARSRPCQQHPTSKHRHRYTQLEQNDKAKKHRGPGRLALIALMYLLYIAVAAVASLTEVGNGPHWFAEEAAVPCIVVLMVGLFAGLGQVICGCRWTGESRIDAVFYVLQCGILPCWAVLVARFVWDWHDDW